MLFLNKEKFQIKTFQHTHLITLTWRKNPINITNSIFLISVPKTSKKLAKKVCFQIDTNQFFFSELSHVFCQ
jgi:hypothetical protein